jgi:archaeal flagellar protein FlaJ
MERVFYVAARVFPKAVKGDITTLLRYCGSDKSAEYWLGRALVISAAIFVIGSVVFWATVENLFTSMLLLAVALTLYHTAAYLAIYFKAENRGKAVERVLPSFLQLIAANINSGMTPFQAFRESSRPEFGILKEEIDKTIALSLSTMQFPEALMDMTGRVKSAMFKDIIELLLDGMRTGGPLATLLMDMANDITENMDLKREIVTRSKSYVLFIAFIVIVGTPLLSVVSTYFIRIIGDITSQVASEMPDMENLSGISFGQLNLTPEFLAAVSVVNIALTSLIASWLVAVISEGKDKYTVKYALIILPAAFVMYYIFNYLIGMVVA